MNNEDKTGLVLLAPNGMIAAFVDGETEREQCPELQEFSAAGLWAAHAKGLGYDPERFIFETSRGCYSLVRDDLGNYRFGEFLGTIPK